MKKITFILLAAFLSFSFVSKALDASVSFATFKSPDQNFVEIYLHVSGRSVHFDAVDSLHSKASVEVVILFKKGENIVKFDKYVLHSPLSKSPADFIDLKRYALKNGKYDLEVTVSDLNNAANTSKFAKELKMFYSGTTIQQSDIQLLASFEKAEEKGPFVKNGYYMEPLSYHFYPKNTSVLSFYCEIYHADVAIKEDFLLSYFIEKETKEKKEKIHIKHKRLTAQPLIPLLLSTDISELESGNYKLIVEIRDRENSLLKKKTTFFQRSNPYLQQDKTALVNTALQNEFVQKLTPKQLEYSLRALTPKLPQQDVELVNYMLKDDSLNAQRLYLFNYWSQVSASNPEFAYSKYMEVAQAVEKLFKSGFRYGFETDRGFIFLKYGKPDDIITVEDEPSAPPYEIWSYNAFPATGQNNVRFLFYNPSLAAGDFILLHSNAIGELNNRQWQLELYRDAPNELDGTNYIDGTQMQDNFNRRAARYFEDF